ncbi:MAG: hypothetical protein WCQ90_15025 [Deltaproteobacteria bacterium]
MTKAVYRNLAITAAEFFGMPAITRENLHEWVELEGLEHFEAGIAQGKGLLTIIAHFGNWELMPLPAPFFLNPSYIICRPLDSHVLDNIQRFTMVVEDSVREYPDQWFWLHQRWKT